MNLLPFRPIAEAPRDGTGILAYGRHDRDDPPGAARGVKAGDHWWAILLFDIWRSPWTGWVFAKDGTPAWSEPTHFLGLIEPVAGPLLVYPLTLTGDLAHVLGLDPYDTGGIAHALRAWGGEDVPSGKAQQAHVLHWLTTLVLKHGPAWRDVAEAHLSDLRTRAGEAPVSRATSVPIARSGP